MLLRDIKNIKEKDLTPVTNAFKELLEENFEVDLEGEDLEEVLNLKITDEMLSKVEIIIANKKEWDYFDVMKAIKFI